MGGLFIVSSCRRCRRRCSHIRNVISYDRHKENPIRLRSLSHPFEHLPCDLSGHRDWRRGKRLVVLRRTSVPTCRFDIRPRLLRWQTENVSEKIDLRASIRASFCIISRHFIAIYHKCGMRMTYQWYCGDEKIAVPLPTNLKGKKVKNIILLI